MDVRELLAGSSAHLAARMQNVSADDLSKPTPCTEFDVKGLLNHIFAGMEMLTTAARTGEAKFDPELDRVGSDIGGDYARAREELLEAFAAEGVLEKTLTMPFGALPGQNVAGIGFMEHLVHAWDLSKATGQDPTLPEDLATACLEMFTPMDAMLRGPGVFGPKVEVAEDASVTDKLVAFAGRTP